MSSENKDDYDKQRSLITMSPVGAGAAVDHHRHQVVHPVGVDGVVRGVEQPELQGEDHSVGDLSHIVA